MAERRERWGERDSGRRAGKEESAVIKRKAQIFKPEGGEEKKRNTGEMERSFCNLRNSAINMPAAPAARRPPCHFSHSEGKRISVRLGMRRPTVTILAPSTLVRPSSGGRFLSIPCVSEWEFRD